MRGLVYLYKRTIVNNIKRALKRPATYIWLVFAIAYLLMMGIGFATMIEEGNFGTPENIVAILSIIIFAMIPGNIISYSKRRGLLFRPSEVHFVFSAPVSPKMVLMFEGVKSFAGNLVIGVFIVVFGGLWFHIPAWQLIVYFLFFVVFESILEASIIIFCFGNEYFGEKFFKRLPAVMYLFMAAVAGAALYKLLDGEPSFSLICDYFAMPIVQLLPIVGWNVAVTRLVFLGPDMFNLIGTALYLISVIGMFVFAWKMKCTGEYYEDAMKFADDYQKLRENQKKGVANVPWKKKNKLRKASVEYKGAYAKAIYFRQILEYKKNPTFIFGWNTLLCLALGVAIAVICYFNDAIGEFGEAKIFIVPAVVSYVVFVFSGYATKWSKELENPYTYMIPDSPLKKVWYATKIEHIRSSVDGILATLPGAVVLGLSPVMTVLTVLLYICLNANKLYYNMLADVLIGNLFGNVGRSMVRMLFQGFAIGIAAVAALVGGLLIGLEAGFFLMILVMGILTFAGAMVASLSFNRMEVRE